jgi:hypothetical protein
VVIEKARIVKMAPTEDIVALLTSVTSYGGQLSTVIHNHVLTCDPHPGDFEGYGSALNGISSTLSQILGLVRDHLEHGKNVFSTQGLDYAHLLAAEFGNTLFNIETTVANGCLDREERKALKKKQKSAPATVAPVIDLTNLSLDEEAFLKAIEKVSPTREQHDIRKSFSRLHFLQLHLVLLYQVVTFGTLSNL